MLDEHTKIKNKKKWQEILLPLFLLVQYINCEKAIRNKYELILITNLTNCFLDRLYM